MFIVPLITSPLSPANKCTVKQVTVCLYFPFLTCQTLQGWQVFVYSPKLPVLYKPNRWGFILPGCRWRLPPTAVLLPVLPSCLMDFFTPLSHTQGVVLPSWRTLNDHFVVPFITALSWVPVRCTHTHTCICQSLCVACCPSHREVLWVGIWGSQGAEVHT